MPATTPVIETHQLTKVYEGASRKQDVTALKDLDLSIKQGEIFAYLGPNGSGKTTTIKLLLRLIFPTSGSMEIMGRKDVGRHDIRKNIGYLPEGAYYPDFLRGEEVLRYYGRLYGLSRKELPKRIDEVLETVGMSGAKRRYVRGYSKGMRQRIGLAQALINDPQILILDEPTTGLDPIARKEIRDILVRLRDEGKTLLISSHELLEVELISDRVGILYQGVLQTCGALEDLLVERDLLIDVRTPPESALEGIRAAGIELEDTVQEVARLRVPGSATLYDALERCKAQNLEVVSVSPRRETLEELFVRVVGQAGGESEAEMTSVATETADNEESS